MKAFRYLGASTLVILLSIAPGVSTAALAKLVMKASAPAHPAQRQLVQLMDDYYMTSAQFDPLAATIFGDNRFDDQLGMNIGPKQRAAYFAQLRHYSERLKGIDPALLHPSERISYDILEYNLAGTLAREPFPTSLMPVGVSGGAPASVANYASGDGAQPINTVKEYRAYLSRVRQLSDWIDQAIVNMRIGIKTGVVQPKSLTVAAIPKYTKMISETPEASLFYTPIKNLRAVFTDEEKKDLTKAYREEIGSRLNPALVRMSAFLRDEYLPAGRETSGLSALPNGRAWYAERVAFHTTSAMTPEQVHQLGLQEVMRIQQQFAVVGPKMGYTGAPSGLPKWVEQQPQYRPFKKHEEIIAFYRDLDKRMAPKLAAMFTLQPKALLEHRLEPELTRATASDHYSAPSPDGSRPGIFWSVVNDPTQYQSTKMTTLLLHEGSPGHHFQLALQQEMALPDFRRFGWLTAFGEGWALYAESLGKEMGMFDAPDQYFGHLNDELLRAARLVVDTGLHDRGWTREQAIAYMRETLGHSEVNAKIAAERYMAQPGQALGYKVGQLKISALRQKAASALGPKFVLSEFHRVVLEDGAMPLEVLEKKVNRWINASK